MAQQFQVLRCCSCNIFQVQQIKKSKKWNCKMCGEKQSVLRVFGQGSGFDCRCHVQKLNLLQGEEKQTPVKKLWHEEGPGERGDENTVVRLEENLGRQEQKMGLTSRWTKYLDKRCEEEEEEEMVLTEKQIYHSRRNMTKNPRKRKTASLYPTDIQGPDQKSIVGLSKNTGSFESERGSVIADTKSYVDTTCRSLITPAEELLVHGVNEEPRSRGAVLSKWEKFLLSDEYDNSSGMPISLQERLETPVKTPIVPASAGKAGSFIDVTPFNGGPAPKQYAPNMLDQFSNTEHIGVTSLPTSNRSDTPVLASSLKASLLNKQPEELASVPASNSPAATNVKNLHRSFFSTGDDFDDYF